MCKILEGRNLSSFKFKVTLKFTLKFFFRMAFQSEIDSNKLLSLTNARNIKEVRIENKKHLISNHIATYLRMEENLSKFLSILL